MPASATKSRQCASRLSPIEKRGNCCASSTSTSQPRRLSSAAAIEPDGPAPITMTSRCSMAFALTLLVVPRFAGRAQSLRPQQHGHAHQHFHHQPHVQDRSMSHVVEEHAVVRHAVERIRNLRRQPAHRHVAPVQSHEDLGVEIHARADGVAGRAAPASARADTRGSRTSSRRRRTTAFRARPSRG